MYKNLFPKIGITFLLFIISSPIILDATAEKNESVNVSNSIGESRRAQLLVEENNVYVVWNDKTPGNDEIFFAKSTDGGKSFDEPINLSQNEGPSAFPRVAVSGSNVYVIWYDYSPGQSDIFFAKSNDGGRSFKTTNISDTPMPSYNPWIAASSNYVYVVFNDGGRTALMEFTSGETRIVDVNSGDEEIILLRSEDYGETFEFINLSNTPGITSWNARISVLGPNVFVNWNERVGNLGKSDVFFTKSDDSGNSFSGPINLSNNPLDSVDSLIAVDKNNLHIVWNDASDNSTDIFFVKSIDNGNTFDPPINLSHSISKSIMTRDNALAVSGEKIFVVWYDESKKENYVFFTKSVDGGLTFSDPINLSPNNAVSVYVQVVANENNVYVIWHDYSEGNGDIFLRESTDNGKTFGGIKNLSNNDYESNIFILGPQIALFENQVYAIWNDKVRDGADLYLTSFVQSQNLIEIPWLLSTSNNAVNVEISFNGEKIDVEDPTNFTLRFVEPSSGILLDEVNYSIEVFDATGKKIDDKPNLFAKAGTDSQTITFPEKGPYTILFNIKGTGTDIPYDTAHSGTVSFIITVVPEFPFGIIMSLGIVLGLVTLFSFARNQLFIQKYNI